MNQDRVPINEVGARDEDEGAASQAAHRQGLVIQPCASAYRNIHFFFDEIDRAIGGDDLHPDQRVARKPGTIRASAYWARPVGQLTRIVPIGSDRNKARSCSAVSSSERIALHRA